jgi:hypothetical protein
MSEQSIDVKRLSFGILFLPRLSQGHNFLPRKLARALMLGQQFRKFGG